jgi:hypothetical protein
MATSVKVNCGKGCIRFKRIADLNLSTVENILREILKLREQGIGAKLPAVLDCRIELGLAARGSDIDRK